MKNYYYYRLDSWEQLKAIEQRPLQFSLWKPGKPHIKPHGLSFYPFVVWSIFHYFGIFENQEYSIGLIYDGHTVIHRTCVFPKYFRFPFMKKDDIQLGDLWTKSEHRGKGFATYMITELVKLFRKQGRSIWYVVEPENHASINVIEKCGFLKVGNGIRTNKFGLRFLGKLVISDPLN